MSLFVSDSFTDTDAVLLQNHTGETGATWTKHGLYTSGDAAIASNRVYRSSAGNSVYYASGNPASADYRVSAIMRVVTAAGGECGVIGRAATGSVSWYSWTYSGSLYQLYVNASLLGTVTIAATAGESYLLQLEMEGTAIRGYVQRVSDSLWLTSSATWSGTRQAAVAATNGTVTTAGKAALWMTTATSTTGRHLDSFEAGPIVDPAVIAVNDAGLFWSPYTWRISGSSFAESNNTGAYLRTVFTGTSVTLSVDVSNLTGASTTALKYPAIKYRVDGGSWSRTQLSSSSTDVSLATGLSDSSHNLEVVIAGLAFDIDRFTTPVSALKITGLKLDNGKAVSLPTLRTNRVLVFGDSNTEGLEILAAGTTVANTDSVQAWPYLIARPLDAEVGVVAFASQGYISGLVGANTGSFSANWDLYSTGNSRLVSGLLSPAPDTIIINHGDNDPDTDSTTTGIIAVLGELRTAAPLAKIVVCVPVNLELESRIRSAVTSVGDANTVVCDPSEIILQNDYANSAHMNTLGHAIYAPIVVASAVESGTVEINTAERQLLREIAASIYAVIG